MYLCYKKRLLYKVLLVSLSLTLPQKIRPGRHRRLAPRIFSFPRDPVQTRRTEPPRETRSLPNQQESRREVSVSVSARAGREKTYGGRRRLAATSSTISGWGLGQATPRRRPPTHPPPASCCACALPCLPPPERRDLGIGSNRPPFILGPFPTGAEPRGLSGFSSDAQTHRATQPRIPLGSASRHGSKSNPRRHLFEMK